MGNKKLLVVMPIYNESESIEKTFLEWNKEFKRTKFFSQIDLLLINDGSTDNTGSIIEKIKLENENVIICNRKNSGHGPSCLYGYRWSVQNDYEYTMQLDSDGQCDPIFFKSFVTSLINGSQVVYGFRYYRKDGFLRFLISRILSFVSFFKTGRWLWDPNVPYRIFKTNTLIDFINIATEDFFLTNVLLAIYHKKFRIKLVPITFRDRHGGSPSLNTIKLINAGRTFYEQLGRIKSI
jgi:dolichol-phosphate mannosyltransferase